jgi:thiamine-monophosphate kinase
VTWSEDEIHRWLGREARPRGLAGSRSHDAAVLESLRGRPVICVDQTIEGVHFEPSTSPARIGRKAAARAISDLAATAARPRALLLAVSIPRGRSNAWIRKLITGAREIAREHGADLVGGDLSISPGGAHVSATALGEYVGAGTPPGRDRARAGQVVILTGAVGGSGLGRHLAIEPRVALGERLHRSGASAMMDVSDGLAWDLHRLARASRVRIDLELARIPVHADAIRAAKKSGKPPLWHALHDGEDHELVATLDPDEAASVLRAARRRGLPLAAIGRVRRGRGLRLVGARGGSRPWRASEGGYEHGG